MRIANLQTCASGNRRSKIGDGENDACSPARAAVLYLTPLTSRLAHDQTSGSVDALSGPAQDCRAYLGKPGRRIPCPVYWHIHWPLKRRSLIKLMCLRLA